MAVYIPALQNFLPNISTDSVSHLEELIRIGAPCNTLGTTEIRNHGTSMEEGQHTCIFNSDLQEAGHDNEYDGGVQVHVYHHRSQKRHMFKT